MAAAMPAQCRRMRRPSSTKAGIRQRWAQAHHWRSIAIATGPLIRNAIRNCSLSR